MEGEARSGSVRLRDLGTDEGSVIGLPDDPDGRFHREARVRFGESLGRHAAGVGFVTPWLALAEAWASGGSPLPRALAWATLAVFAASISSFARRRPWSRGLETADLILHTLAGAVLGTLGALAPPADRVYYWLVVSLLLAARCLEVRGPWRNAAGAAIGGWVTTVGATFTTDALAGVELGGARLMAVEALLGAQVALGVYGAQRLEDLQRLETRARSRGRYRVQGRVGGGGYGEVYRAWDSHLDRACALKILPLGTRDSEAALVRFEQEVLVTSRLQGKGVVTVYDFGTTKDGRLFFVMELLDGFDLFRLVTARGPLPVRTALRFVRQAAAALEVAHRAGLAHGDVKPANLVVVGEGEDAEVKLLDFGLSAALGAAPGERVEGTAGYVAPERLMGRPATPASDLYALGAVLYFLITGYEAFVGPNDVEVARSQLKEVPPKPSLLTAGIPPAVDLLVRRCLEREPEKRYRSMHELQQALRALEAQA